MQSTASQVSQAASETIDVAKNVAEQVLHTVKPAVDFVTPYVQQSADYVYKAVFPVAVDLEKQAENAIQSSGYDTKPVLDAAKVIVQTMSCFESSSHMLQTRKMLHSEIPNADILFPIFLKMAEFGGHSKG